MDWTVVSPLPRDRPLRVLELFAGVGSATQGLVRGGYTVGEVIACEKRGASKELHRWAGEQLKKEFPGRVGERAWTQLTTF